MTDEDLDHGTFGGSSSSFVKAEETTAQRFSALQTQLLCAAIHFFHRHIRSDADVLQRMEGNEMFRLFFEVPYHNKPELNRIFPESVHDCSALHVCSFILSILHQGIFSVSAFIVSVIYLSRFKESSRITLHACTWRPLFLTSLLLADKMWEDKPVRNSSLAKLFPVLSNVELNRMESQFLDEIKFNVLVKPDLFCSFCEKLLAEQVHQEISRCVIQSEYAVTLQAECVDSIPAKVPNGKPQAQVNNTEKVARTNGMTKADMHQAEWQSSPDRQAQPIVAHEDAQLGPWAAVPATWAESMPRGRSQSPTAIKPCPFTGDLQYTQPIDSLRPLVQMQPARSGSVQPREEAVQVEVADVFRGPTPAVAMQQPMRRSLPAKSSNSQYMMLARAPSVGNACAAVKVPPGAMPCEGQVNGCVQSGGSIMAVASGLGMQHSPRSPAVAPSVQGSRSTTPTMACQAMAARAAGTAAPVVAHNISNQKPRSSSAPRVSSVTYAHGANVRASSQPMQPMLRQVPAQPVHAQFSGGPHPYARQVLVSDPAARAVSPANHIAQMARAPVTRGTVGGYPTRKASPTSPGMCQVQIGQAPLATRGRSPAPVITQGLRAPSGPRAATPSIVKPMVAGVHAGMVARHSLGAQIKPGFVA